MWRKIRIGLLGLGVLAGPASAQAEWTVWAGDSTWATVASRTPEGAASDALRQLQDRGLLLARVDSVARDTVFATPGPGATVGRVRVVGADVISADALTRGWGTAPGAPYRRDQLDADVQGALDRYARRGHVHARLTPRLALQQTDGVLEVEVDVEIDEGPVGVVGRVELVGTRRSSSAFAARVVGLVPGSPLDPFDPVAIRRDVEATGLFLQVGQPVLAAGADGQVVVRVPVVEGAPGAFDLVLGYLPPTAGSRGQVVGSGRIDLVNPFGGGRVLGVQFVRNPGLVSSFSASAHDPYLLGLPFSVGGAFEGFTQDSTYSRQRVEGSVGYRVGPGLLVALTAGRESIDPGRAGTTETDGAPRIRRSDAWFYGAEVTFRHLDVPVNPRRGVDLHASVESGVRRRDALADGVLDGAAQNVRQQRLIAVGRVYVPVLGRVVLAVGGDGRVLAPVPGGASGARPFDEAELYRFGGASSLRGYDEDAFLGNAVGRVVIEPRYLLDAESHAFAFLDLGYVARPPLGGAVANRRARPGYGAGLQLRTGLGLVRLSYALNPDLPVGRGRVHVGLRLGL